MRITERIIDEKGKEHIFTKYVRDNQKLKDEKLCQLEDIEDELGIELITSFKALKNGFYHRQGSVIVHISKNDLLLSSGAIHFVGKGLIFAGLFLPFNEYGKTWALTKEELL